MKADSFIQPTRLTGTYGTDSWAGYEHLQPRISEGLPSLRHIGDDYNFGAGDQDLGQDVVTVANGIVEKKIAWNGNFGYGNHLFIRHELTEKLRESIKQNYNIDTSALYSHYAHLDKIFVNEGEEVSKGKLIAKVGKTGTKWAHLHLEIRKPTGRGYEDYPSSQPVSWVNQFYVAPYPFINKYKDPLVDTPPALPPNWEQDLAEANRLKDEYYNNWQNDLHRISDLEGDKKFVIDTIYNSSLSRWKRVSLLLQKFPKV